MLSLDLTNGRIKLVINPKLADKIPANVRAKIDQTQNNIAAGKITVPLPPK